MTRPYESKRAHAKHARRASEHTPRIDSPERVFVCPACRGSEDRRSCGVCERTGRVNRDGELRWELGGALRDVRMREGRSLDTEARLLGLAPSFLLAIELGIFRGQWPTVLVDRFRTQIKLPASLVGDAPQAPTPVRRKRGAA